MSEKPIPAHSIAEAYFYLLVTPCPACESGPRHAQSVQTEEEHIDAILRFESMCSSCQERTSLRFCIDSQWIAAKEPPVVNPSDEPSKIIDVAQWLTLFHTLIGKAGELEDKIESRRIGYEGALCLQEALKFYEQDNDLPPKSAFFSDKTREHALKQPEMFTRQRLIGLRSKLPNLSVMAERLESRRTGKWWQFWKKTRPDDSGQSKEHV